MVLLQSDRDYEAGVLLNERAAKVAHQIFPLYEEVLYHDEIIYKQTVIINGFTKSS